MPMRSLALLLCSVAAVPALAAGADVVHSSEPDGPVQTLSLEEMWTVGGADSDLLFGLMIDARCDENGDVYLLDHQLSQVTRISADGEVLAILGGEGEGPGECRQPQTLAMLPDARVGLGQRFPGRFILVERDGTPAGQIDLGGPDAQQTGFNMLLSGRNRGGTLLVGSLHQVPADGRQSRISRLQTLAPDGTILTQLAEHETVLDFSKPHFVEREMVAPFLDAHAVGPDGRIYLAPERNAYRIEVYEPDGTLVRTITRDYDAPPRDQQTLDRMNALFEEQDRALPFRITWEVEKIDQVVGEIIVTRDNEMWVANSRSGRDLPDGVLARYDVFAPDGTWSREVQVRADADPGQDGLIFLDNGRVLLVRGLQLARLTASGNGGSVMEGEEESAWEIEVSCCRFRD